jgi:hypothetical protein
MTSPAAVPGFAIPASPEQPATAHVYQMYGITLRSEIALTYPERPTTAAADVTFSAMPQSWFARMTAELPALGKPSDWYERRRSPDGTDYLRFPDLFEFAISPDGRSVSFARLEKSTIESFQTYLLGHVLSYVLLKQGIEPLHSTAVVIDGVAVALLGSSARGKSTLAAAFLEAGHRLLTDDLLVVREVDGVLCGLPGPPRIKLYPHVAQYLLPSQASATQMNPESPKLIIPLERNQTHAGPAPIAAFVVLDEELPDVHVSSLSRSDAFVKLVASTFNARLVTPDRLRRQFLATREWAGRIGVLRVQYPRSLADIGRVRDTIVAQVRQLSVRPS